jgi:hypothetical protein
MNRPNPGPSLARRLIWFVFLWLAGVTVVSCVSLLIRTMLT